MTDFKRIKIPDRIRFEAFKRDRFTCQYCGMKAPDVVLNVDHIHPVSDGGTNDLLNLVTSCRDCNSGKSDHKLSDQSAVEKSRNQAELIDQRRQQVKMMAEWQIELARMSPEMEALNLALGTIANRKFNESGERSMRKLLRQFSVQELIEAMAIAFDQYEPDSAISKISGIANNLKIKREDPELAMMHKIINSLAYRLRGPSWKRHDALRALLAARDRGVDWFKLSKLSESASKTWDEYLEEVSK
jgi:hypothetical protein